MAFLREEDKWSQPIYRIERTDPLMGGEFGIANIQAKQLANRTLYLKNRFLVEHDEHGIHRLSNMSLADDAAIAERKLDLDYSTAELFDRCDKALEQIRGLMGSGTSFTELERTLFSPLYQALLLSWRYGYPRFAFELFTPGFTLRGTFPDVELIETIRGDDSIDVAGSQHLVPDETYILWDAKENRSTFVTVKAVLTEKRVILYTDEKITRSRSGVLTKMSWVAKGRYMEAKAGSCYVSTEIPTLENLWGGNLLIAHQEPAKFKVEVHREGHGSAQTWRELPLVDCRYSDNLKLWRSVYATPGQKFSFRITALDDAVVEHLVLMSEGFDSLSSTIRTPEVVDDDFTIVRFGAIYGAKHTGTHFELSKNNDFCTDTVKVSFGPDDSQLPIWDYKLRVLSEYPIATGEDVYWRACYTADDGGTSGYSGIGHYIHGAK